MKQEQHKEQEVTQRKGDMGGLVPSLVGLINRPYILLTVPVLIGGVWLVNNPWVITNNLNQPYALAVAPTAIASGIVGWIIFKFFRTIEAWCKRIYDDLYKARKEGSSDLFFWLVISVFMIVSVLASGSFFDKIEHHVIPGLGHATALFIDLVAINSMRARLGALRIRDKAGANLYLLGVFVCSGASAFANTFTSLDGYVSTASGALPQWMSDAAPWFGLVFPLLILLLSITADYTVDQTNTKLDAAKYEEQEHKRLEVLRVRSNAKRRQLEIEREMEQMDSERKSLRVHKKESDRELFFVRWFFPKKPFDRDVVIAQVTEQMTKKLTEQHTAMQQHIEQTLTRIQSDLRTRTQQDQASVTARIEQFHMQSLMRIEQFEREASERQEEAANALSASFDQQFETAINHMKDACVSYVLTHVREELSNHLEQHASNRSEEMFDTDRAHIAHVARRGTSSRTKRQEKTVERHPSKRKTSAYDQVFDALMEDRQATVSDIAKRTGFSKGTISSTRTKILGEWNVSSNGSQGIRNSETGPFDSSVIEHMTEELSVVLPNLPNGQGSQFSADQVFVMEAVPVE